MGGILKAAILLLLITFLDLVGVAQTSPISFNSQQTTLTVTNDQFSNIQKMLEEQVSRGYQVSNVSYHSSYKNLYTKGKLEFTLEPADKDTKYQYRALVTELHPSILEQQMNLAGTSGFRLLASTPISLESGIIRTQGTFITIMEKHIESSKIYQYRVIAYRNYFSEKKNLKQLVKDGYSEVNSSQLGRITYLVLEKVIN